MRRISLEFVGNDLVLLQVGYLLLCPPRLTDDELLINVDDLYFCSELLVQPEQPLIKAETDEARLPSAPLAAIFLLYDAFIR